MKTTSAAITPIPTTGLRAGNWMIPGVFLWLFKIDSDELKEAAPGFGTASFFYTKRKT